MALLPGATIKGEWKYFCEMTTEELEYLIARQKIKMMLVCFAIGISIAIAMLCIR